MKVKRANRSGNPLPEGYGAQIRPGSGLALKKGIVVLNTPDNIDDDYRGEAGIMLVKLSGDEFVVERGVGGFGHTGIK